MFGLNGRLGSVVVVTAVALLLGGCGSSKIINRAPVEDRGTANKPAPALMDPTTQAIKQPPGFENAGKPGYYTVKPGETLIRIGLDQGQSYKDIARWNSLDNPNHIEIGQVLRVLPPTAGAVTATVAKSDAVANAPAATAPVRSASAEKSSYVAPAPASSTPVPAPVVAAATSEDDIAWIWPTSGKVLAGFDEVKNKGLDIAGTAGDPVLAAADGRVVYVGAGLRGYGNLIILKHNNTFLTAYAHNQTLLIKEDQSVRKGQKIAEMGNSDADRVKLHFEVRRQGKPVDPAKYLPAR